MISFENDYSEGMAKEILEEFIKENEKQASGYELDDYCKDAEKIIKKVLKNDKVDVHFIPGGTPCNLLAASLLKPYEGIICASTAHINVHETGAIENSGHKCLAIDAKDGKLTPELILKVFNAHPDEHMVKPAMVFISDSTELGTIYTKKELIAIFKLCHKLGLILYLDGARLGSALTSKGNDLKMEDLTKYLDIFYIGGTKNGALLGEAMVIVKDELKPCFRYLYKNKGEMLAKGRSMGISFKRFFKDDLYFDLARYANSMADQLRTCFKQTKTKFFVESNTNQIFVVLENSIIKKLKKKYKFNNCDIVDKNHTCVRFVTSWATKQVNIDSFIKDYKALVK